MVRLEGALVDAICRSPISKETCEKQIGALEASRELAGSRDFLPGGDHVRSMRATI